MKYTGLLSCIIFLLFSCYPQYTLLVGTYTSGNKSKGIHAYDFNNKNGTATEIGNIIAANPSYLAVNKNGSRIYSVNENAKGKISSFTYNPKTGAIGYLNDADNSSSSPCYIAIDKTGHWLFAGNYSSGNLSVHEILADGSIGEMKQIIQHKGYSVNKDRQQAPHVHCTYISPDNKFLYVPDLGLDKVMIYPFDANSGKLDDKNSTFYQVHPGGGPRHITFTKDGKLGFLVEEISGAVVVLQRQNNRLKELQRTIDLPAGEAGAGADIHLSPNEKFLYVSQRSNSSIQIYKIDIKNGRLTYQEQQSTIGKWPRNFSIHPSGKFLIAGNQHTHNSVIFKINKKTGLLTDTGNRIDVGSPVCHVWVKKK
ncbi:MAG: lactonase family protein [Niabella sp.]